LTNTESLDIQPPGSPSPSAQVRIPALDGLRGCAILLVIVWHYFNTAWFPGWAGVDLFFVLSGYLITGRLMRTIDDPHYFSRFYRNRILRIFPLYYGLVIPFLLAIFFLVKPEHLHFYREHPVSLLIFTTNWTFVCFGLPHDYSLVPLWSIAVEEQFYLLWPFVILATRTRPKTRIGLLLTVSALILLTRTAIWIGFPTLRDTCYYNTFFRLDSLFAGCLLYQLDASAVRLPSGLIRKIALILLATLLTGIGIMHDGQPQNGFFSTVGYTLNALFFACLLHLALHPGSGRLPRFLSLPPLRYMGKISYCLYLIHVPVLLNIAPGIVRLGQSASSWDPAFIRWTAVLICLALSILISGFSYRYVESFFLRLKK